MILKQTPYGTSMSIANSEFKYRQWTSLYFRDGASFRLARHYMAPPSISARHLMDPR